MADYAHQQTDKAIEQLEKRLGKEYKQAEKELQEKLDDYLRRFQIKDDAWQRMVANGEKTAADYAGWRQSQIMVGDRWAAMKDTIAQDMHNANINARAIITGEMPEVYALNHNFATYQIEKAGHVDTSYTLYNRDAVARIAKDNPDLLRPPGVRKNAEFTAFDAYKAGKPIDLTDAQKAAFDKLLKENKDIRWQKGQIQSVTMQSILQGESIPHMAQRIARTMGETNHKQSLMYARTAMTGAQNAGRHDAYVRAEEMGIKLNQQWEATLDDRTRHEHRQLDGQIRPVDEPFEVDGYEIMYPGDPSADPEMVYNCRCTTIPVVDGWDSKSGELRSNADIEGQTYEEWREGHSHPEPITKQEEIGEAIRQQTIRDLYGGNPDSSGPVPEQEQERVFEFTPAKTIQEAEDYARTFCDETQWGAVGVSYKGVSVDVANEVNRTIGKFYDQFDVEKFGGIIAPAGNTRYGKMMQDATAAYSPVTKSFLLNRNTMKNMATAEKAFKAESDAIKDILQHPERYDFTKASSRLLRVVENSRESGRGTIPTTIEETLNHELGHSLEKAIKRSDAYDEIMERMPQFNHSLSGYACENKSEYIAESFCSYMKGEGKCDPVLENVFESFKRK